MDDKVVVTGVGAICSVGNNTSECWKNLLNGLSGVGYISLFDASDLNVQIACEVKNFNPDEHLSAREARRRDRYEQLAAVAAREAITQAALRLENENLHRVGIVISSSIGGIGTLEDVILTIERAGPRKISPFAIPMLMSNGAAGMTAIDYGFLGPSISVASACASGADAIGIAWTLIKTRVIDIALAGASEATITKTGIASFDRLGAMSRQNQDFSMTPRPFDRDRDGLVMGEGAGILVMERERAAISRGVDILAEIKGYASTVDAYHITAPSEYGAGGARAIKYALQQASFNFEDVDYINAHGTATILNDLSETRAIKTAFGDLAYRIPVSSTKSMTGHTMGATGALEAIFCVMAVQEDIIPPTIHYENQDPECDLDYVPNFAREIPVRVAISNSFGFGGHNAVLVIKKYT